MLKEKWVKRQLSLKALKADDPRSSGKEYKIAITLQAGISDPGAEQASRGGGGGSLTISGGRPISNNFLMDGTNIMNTENLVPRSAAGVQLGSDAVLQVQVLSQFYGAEWGRGSGGVLNSITRSGTPAIHGTVFEYLRNSKLDARSFFDPGVNPPPFKRNQFGFTLTGPIRKDRTYFMGSFEAMRDRLTSTETDFFPDKNARLGIIETLDAQVERVCGTGFRKTPLTRSTGLSDHLGFTSNGGVWVKDETHNVAGSHKARHLFGELLHVVTAERTGAAPWRDASARPPLAIASCGNAAFAASTLAKALKEAFKVPGLIAVNRPVSMSREA